MKFSIYLIVFLLLSLGSVSAVEEAKDEVQLSNDEPIYIGGAFPVDILGGTVYVPDGWYIYPFRDANGNMIGDGVFIKLDFLDFANKEIRNLKDLSDDDVYIYYMHGRSDIDRKQFKGKLRKIGNMNGSTVFVYPASDPEVGNLFLYPLHATYFRSNIPADSKFAIQHATEVAMIVFSFKGK